MNAISSAMSSAMSTISTDVGNVIAAVLPYALTIVGLGLAITLGVKYFKKVAGK